MAKPDFSVSRIRLGKSDLKISRMGLGCMSMSEFYGPPCTKENAISVMRKAFDMGINFFDTADMYGQGHNEYLLGKAFNSQSLRKHIVIGTKFGVVRETRTGEFQGLNGRPSYVKEACEKSLQRLNTDRIDLYYYHRIDPLVPVEETVGAMADLVIAGKVRYIGLSKVTAEILERAHQVHPITAIQNEYSYWMRDAEKDILPTCKKLQSTFVSYSPLGRGYLTGKIPSRSVLSKNDYRLGNPRFSKEKFQENWKFVTALQQISEQKNATISQVALAWMLHQHDDLVLIPGTSNLDHLLENHNALKIALSPSEVKSLNKVHTT